MINPHSQCLQDICRLCGQKGAQVEGRNPVSKESISRKIREAFNVVVADDVSGVHPPFVCKLCQLKLGRWWSKYSGRNMKAAKCNIEIAVFANSECDGCKIKVPLPIDEELCFFEDIAKVHHLQTWYTADKLQIVKIDSAGFPVAYLSILRNLSWAMTVSGMDVTEDVVSLDTTLAIDLDRCAHLCSLMSTRVICRGNDDFGDLVDLKKGPEGQVPVAITPQDVFLSGTIRHKRCKLLIAESGQRCEVCQIHRSDLAGIAGRLKAKGAAVITASSTIPNKAMTYQQLQQKAVSLQADRRSLKRKNSALQEKISSLVRDESIVLEANQEELIRSTMKSEESEVDALFPEGSPARLLWDQQMAAASKGKQMRWHPAIIRWCIALHSKSSSSYNLMRDSGFIKLPHPTTLHSYSHFADATPGFSFPMLKRIADEQNLESCPEIEKNVSLLFDEMKVKTGLVYSVRSGKLIGFTDMGEIDNEIREFNHRCKREDEVHLATHVLVVMMRGLFSSLHAPVGYYPSEGVSSSQLYPCLSEAVLFVETAGFKVRAFVSDGASANRKLYRLLKYDSPSPLTHFTPHPLDPARKIFFICDVPHLMKTTRNNFENSGYNNKTKNLVYNKQSISWSQLLQLYEWDVGLERASPGLRRLHKITYEHLHLSPSLRMRVYMAVQVLSSTVANCFESLGRSDTSSTVKFIRFMDKFFDCLNVSNPHQGIRSRNPTLAPYTSPNDWRFEWLISDFLGFLKEWEDQVQAIPDLDPKTRKSMCLSKETSDGLRITVHSFVELAQELLKDPGVKYILSEKLNQDPLEEYFSKQRGVGGSWDNPTVEQFGHNMLALHVAASSIKSSKKGNSKNINREDGPDKLDSTPLPRRK